MMVLLTKIFLAFKTIKNIHVFMLDYIGFLHRDIKYYIRDKRIKVITRGGTPDCKQVVLILSGYEYRLNILPSINNPIIFDVGAHIGSFSLFAFEYYKFTNPRIFIFEPNKENFKYLKNNVEINNISSDKYILYNCAIGDYDGSAKLDKSKQSDAYAVSVDPKGEYDICSIRTLPSIARDEGIRNIDILKLDIEGGEYNLFKHAESVEFMINRVSFIIMEHHYIDAEENINWIKNCLRDHFNVIFQRNDVVFFKNRLLA